MTISSRLANRSCIIIELWILVLNPKIWQYPKLKICTPAASSNPISILPLWFRTVLHSAGNLPPLGAPHHRSFFYSSVVDFDAKLKLSTLIFIQCLRNNWLKRTLSVVFTTTDRHWHFDWPQKGLLIRCNISTSLNLGR